MGLHRIHQSNFNKGELDPNLISRTDLVSYGAGLQKSRNTINTNQGPVERRGGTYFRADLAAQSRLESFIFSEDQEYIFAFQNTALKIYSTAGVLLQTITSCPWETANLFELNFTQQGDTMIIVHKDIAPTQINRTGATTFTKTTFTFDESVNGEKVYQPYFKFASDTITLDINSVTKDATGVTCTTSSAYWSSDYVGMRIRYMGAELLITGYTSTTVVTATLKSVPLIELDEDPFATAAGSGVVTVTHVAHGFSTGASVVIAGAEGILDTDGGGLVYGNVNGTFSITVTDDNHWQFTADSSDTATESVDGGGVRVTVSGHPPTRNWDEQVFSAVNGYPRAITFHENRLFFGGVTALPDGIQGSSLGAFFNFDEGTAEDSESVQVNIASNEINEIRHLVSGKVLEVLTNTSEFYLKPPIGKPITPTDISIVRQSTLGVQQKAMPKIFDGGTIYIQNNGKTIREYVYSASLEQFSSGAISLESNHLIVTPTDSAFVNSLPDRTEQFYFVVNTDGTIAVYSSQRAQKIFGWNLWSTQGVFESIACTTSNIYVAVNRPIDVSCTVTVTDYANIAVGTQLTFTKQDGTVITLESEASSGSAPSSSSGNTHYFRPNESNDTTADNIYTALNAVSGLTVANPAAAVVTVVRDDNGSSNFTTTTTDSTRLAVTNFVGNSYYLEQFASTSFDISTDMTVTKTLSGSYQPHGTPLVKGSISSSATLIADGFTNAPQVGEKFQFGGTGASYTIQSSTYTGTSGEYAISVNVASSQSDNATLIFTHSKTWSALNSTPDMRGLTAYATSGSTEGDNINYYGDGVVNSSGVVIFDSVATAIDIGIDYTLEINTLPVDGVIKQSLGSSPLTSFPRKIAKAIIELASSYNIKVNGMDVLIPTVSDIDTSDALISFTGKKEVFFLGYDTEPYLTITQSAPLPLRILGITSEIYY